MDDEDTQGTDEGSPKSDNSDDGQGNGAGSPVLIDLSGNGLNVSTLSSSSQFVNVNGDGYQHRMAWAGNGSGVLAFDADGDGKISNSKEFEFTQWDPTATGDLEAIKDVFDTNGNGKLDAGDAKWSKFKVMVNGQLVSLSSLGITSIDLTPKGSGQTFSDGSAITGTTTYTKSDGSTGAVGDAVLASDSNGYIVKSTVVTNSDQSKTNTIQAYNADGSLAFQNLVTTSADGNSVSTKFDDDGNGTYDRWQTDVTTVASGIRTRVVTDFNADGSVVDSTTTVTSADHKMITTSVDQDGDGKADQSQVFVTNSDGSTTTTTKTLSASGTTLSQVQVQSSIDGLTKTTSTDVNGDGTYDEVVSDVTVVAGDGSRTRTLKDSSANGTLISSVTTVTSADRHTKTVTSDLDGNGTVDERDQTQTTIASNGDVTTVVTTTNGDNSARSKVTTVAAANGLSTTVSTDVTGDGVADLVHSDVTTVGSDGSRTETVQDKSASGVLLSSSITVTSVDGKSKNISLDANGDGAADQQTIISVADDGTITETDSTLNPNGTLVGKVLTTTGADGLSKTVSTDANGDGTYDVVTTDVITAGTGGARVETVTTKSGNGSLNGQTVTTTSADSLTQTVQSDVNGDGVFDKTVTDVIVLNAGARTETVTTKSGNGTLLGQTVTTVSADRKTTGVTKDIDGDGHVDSASAQIIAADGSQTTTTIQASADGGLHRKTVVTVSADKLTTTTADDLNGDGVVDVTTVDQTVINADGSRTETVTDKSNTGVLLDKVTTVTSGNGLTTTVQKDVNGDGTVDSKTAKAVVLNNDGSKTTTSSDYAGTSLTDQTKVTVSANGLTTTTSSDYDGNGTVDRLEVSTKTLNTDGSTSVADSVSTAGGTLLSKTTTTTTADGRTVTSQVDLDGDGKLDVKTTTVVDATGQTTKTVETYKVGTTTLASRAVTTTAGNGLSVTTSSDLDGDGVYEQVITDVMTLNADGSKTETVSRFGAGSTLISKTATTTSGNGLSKQTSWTDGTGAALRSGSDVTTLNADGSTVEVVTNTGAVANKTTTITSGDGKTVTVTYDIDGNGVVDQKSLTVKNADGSVTRTLSDLTSTGVVAHSETIVTGPDGLGQTFSYDTDGNGSPDKYVTDQTTLYANGSKATLEKVYVANSGGTLVQNASTQTETSADGLAVTTRWDQTGSGTFTKFRADVTVLNADGSRTQTVSFLTGTTLTSRYLTTTSANGLSITSQSDMTGAGTYAQTSTDVTVINADGTRTRTVSSTKADGSLISKFVTTTNADGLIVSTSEQRTGLATQTVSDTLENLADGSRRETVATTDASGKLLDKTITLTSADKRTVTIDRDANGDGVIDQHQQTVTADSGVTTQSVADYKSAGVKADGSTSTTTANGLQTMTDWDVDGNGTADRRRITVNTNNADGSKVSVMSDTDLTTNKLASKTTIQQSSDGLMHTTSKDVDGDGTVDQVETLTADTTGASVSIVTNNATAQKANYLLAGKIYWKQAIAAKVETDSSADGRTKTVKYDYDGNGTYEVVMQSQLQVDGSTVATVTETNASGAVIAKGTITTSTDGLITVLSKDSNNDGVIDHTETSVTHNDGSVTLTKVDLNASSAVTQTVVDAVSAMGSLALRVTSNGQGQVTSQLAIAGDGSSITTTYNAAGGQVLSTVNANKAGIITSAVIYDPLNANPWSRIEQSFDANGKETQEKQFNDDGTRTEITFDANNTQWWSRVDGYYDINGRLFYQVNYNDDGTRYVFNYDVTNVQSWSSYVQLFNAAGQLQEATQYNDDGSRIGITYDLTNVQSWSRLEQGFDAAGRLTNQTAYYDDGTKGIWFWDPANGQSWSEIDQSFNTAGQMTNQKVINDDGSQVQYTWDVANTQPWSSVMDVITPSVKLLSHYVYSDDQSKWTVTSYDVNNNQSWTSVVQSFVNSGVINTATYYNDDGSYTNVEYDGSGAMTAWQRFAITSGGGSPNGGGGSGYQMVDYWPQAHSGHGPVLLDLNGDGHIDLRPLDTNALMTGSSVTFDWNNDGARDGTAWVGPQDGFLAIDLGENGQAGPDGKIDQSKELAFSEWATPEQVAANGGSVSDLDGLRLAFDSNHDNVLDASDDRWSEFRVWRDANQNGVVDDGELQTMSQAGIKLINLLATSDGSHLFSDGSAITGTSSYQTTDGTSHYLVGDATLSYQPAIPKQNAA
ncbi:adhesin [Rhizobium sp. P44RR-XXIV]|uniref:adhesin n=1 Tax=Rhizobium sp. P44RR-XXIV TaxID=1921145 RepID=UPI00098411FE|nr:adhesin [Rhizobium sp. P44RR-XXIV]TIX90750.1 adhesin [Rhizobium sp. P44RR-XXIV]